MKTKLPDRLRELRKDRSQADFAKDLGLLQQTYARWESGQREPDLEKLENIAHRFGVTTDWLLGRTEEKPTAAPGNLSPPNRPITPEDLSNLILQNTELCRAAASLGRSHERISDTNAQLAQTNAELMKRMVEKLDSKACTPATTVPTGGGRATKRAAG